VHRIFTRPLATIKPGSYCATSLLTYTSLVVAQLVKKYFLTSLKDKENSSMASQFLLLGVLLTLTCSVALASDPGPLQDFCVADKNSSGIHIIFLYTTKCISSIHVT
jgi:hypothetical protein